MRSAKGELRRMRKSGELPPPTLDDSRVLGWLVADGTALDQKWTAREVAVAMGVSRRTARRAMTYARRIEEVRNA